MSQAPKASTAPAANQAPPLEGMAERLAARLKQNGADLNGWVMLIRSYSVMKQPAKMQEAAEFRAQAVCIRSGSRSRKSTKS